MRAWTRKLWRQEKLRASQGTRPATAGAKRAVWLWLRRGAIRHQRQRLRWRARHAESTGRWPHQAGLSIRIRSLSVEVLLVGDDHFRRARHSERIGRQQRKNETELVAHGDLDGAAGRIGRRAA